MSLRFILTSHGHLDGVRLSLIGDRGNLPFPDEPTARVEAERMARGRPYTIERKRYPALASYRREADALR